MLWPTDPVDLYTVLMVNADIDQSLKVIIIDIYTVLMVNADIDQSL